MHLVSRQSLAETNRWFRERTLAAVVAALPEEPVPSSLVQILGEALDRLDVPAHQAGAGERLRSALPFGAPWGKGVIALAAELQFLSSEFRGEYIERSTPFSATIQVALECPEFALAEACLAAALRICARLHCGQGLEMGQEYRAARRRYSQRSARTRRRRLRTRLTEPKREDKMNRIAYGTQLTEIYSIEHRT